MQLQFPGNGCHFIPRSRSSYRRVYNIFCNKEYLTAAGAILTIEARHNTYIIGSNKGNPVPAAFDTPLDFDEVYTLASAFIVSCPSTNPALPVKAFPDLTVMGSTSVKANETITVGGQWTNGIYAVILSGLGTYPVQVENNQFMFPSASISGQVLHQSFLMVQLLIGYRCISSSRLLPMLPILLSSQGQQS